MAVRTAVLDLAELDALKVDTYVVFLSESERPPTGLAGLLDWRLAGALSRLLRDGIVDGSQDDALLASTGGLAEGHTLPGSRLFVFGLGSRPSDFDNVANTAVERLTRAGVQGAMAAGVPGSLPGDAAKRSLEAAFGKLRGADVVIAEAAPSPLPNVPGSQRTFSARPSNPQTKSRPSSPPPSTKRAPGT